MAAIFPRDISSITKIISFSGYKKAFFKAIENGPGLNV